MTHSNTYVTLDSIIRKLLAKNQLTLHFYAPFYLHAKDAVDELFQIHSPQYKVAEVTITGGVGTLPADCIMLKEMYIPNGDMKKLYLEDNTMIDQSTVPVDDESVADWINGVYQGNSWAAGENFVRSYVEIPGENKFRIKAVGNDEITKVYISYTYDNSVISNQTMVHPLMERPIYDFIRWQRAGHASMKRLDVQLLMREYYNSLRIFRAAISKLTPRMVGRMTRRAKNNGLKTNYRANRLP